MLCNLIYIAIIYMKVVMKSEDRVLFGVTIKQKTDKCFLSVSDLTNAYTVIRLQKGWSERNLTEIVNSNQFQERLFYLLSVRADFVKLDFSSFMESITNEGTVKFLKKHKLWQTTGRAQTRDTWCDPYIWIGIALEMNPMIYAMVITWLTDRLIFNRIEAGINYRPLTDIVNEKFNDIQFYHYINIAKAINKKIFGEHYPNIRNSANEKQLSQLNALEVFLHNLIEADVITNYQETITWIDKFKLPK